MLEIKQQKQNVLPHTLEGTVTNSVTRALSQESYKVVIKTILLLRCPMMGLLFSHEYWRCPALSHKCPRHYKPLSTWLIPAKHFKPTQPEVCIQPYADYFQVHFQSRSSLYGCALYQCYRQREPKQGKDTVFISVQWIKPVSWNHSCCILAVFFPPIYRAKFTSSDF